MKAYLKRIAKAVLNRPVAVYKAEREYKVNVSDEGELKGRIALVTGGSGTLGRSICNILAAQGAVVYVGGRSKERIESVVSGIVSLGGTAKPALFDITDEKSVKNMIDEMCRQEGKLDILVNCAGGSARGKISDLINKDLQDAASVLASNLIGTITCSKYAAEKMSACKQGCIINISSTIGVQGFAGYCDYAAAKSGIIGFTKALAQEIGKFGIRVNCVSPGVIQRGTFTNETVEYLQNTNYLCAVGEPEDVANGVEFLVSDRAKFITGINLVIDGGRILGLHTFNS